MFNPCRAHHYAADTVEGGDPPLKTDAHNTKKKITLPFGGKGRGVALNGPPGAPQKGRDEGRAS